MNINGPQETHRHNLQSKRLSLQQSVFSGLD